MHLVDHLLRTAERRILEIHGVPQVVVPPILPVLNYAIERYAQLAVAANLPHGLILTLVTLLALHETVAPQRHHRHVSRQGADLAYHPVGRAAEHEIIIHTVTHVGAERGLLVVVDIERSRIVVPEDTVTLGRLGQRRHILNVALHQIFGHVALHHLPVLQLAESVEPLAVIRIESLIHGVCIASGVIERRKGTVVFRLIWMATIFRLVPTFEMLMDVYVASWVFTGGALLIVYLRHMRKVSHA